MSNALHDYAKLFERYAANNGGTGVILEGEDCLSLANEMRMDADVIEAENAKLRKLLADAWGYINHPADATWTHNKRKEVRDSIGDRMRELGIEVDDAG